MRLSEILKPQNIKVPLDAKNKTEAISQLVFLLAENKEITKHLSRAELARLCDPANYLGQSGVMVDRVLESVRAKRSTVDPHPGHTDPRRVVAGPPIALGPCKPVCHE